MMPVDSHLMYLNVKNLFNKAQDEVLLKVANQVLKRQATTEDFKDFCIMTYPDVLYYDLAYKNVLLGRVDVDIKYDSVTVRFNPIL